MLFTLHILTSLAPLVSKLNALFLVKEFMCQNFANKETIHIISPKWSSVIFWFLVFFFLSVFFSRWCTTRCYAHHFSRISTTTIRTFFLRSIICLSFTTGEHRWPWSVHKMICVRYIRVIRKFRILVAIVEIWLIQKQMLIENLWPRYIRERADWRLTTCPQFRPNWSAFVTSH